MQTMNYTKKHFSHYENGYSGAAIYKTITAEIPAREKLTAQNISENTVVVRPLFDNSDNFISYQPIKINRVQLHGFDDGQHFYDVDDWFIGNDFDINDFNESEKQSFDMIKNGEQLIYFLDKCQQQADQDY